MSGQERREGEVTYITSQHVYVKLSSMENLSEGDTLYIKQGDKELPALQVKNLSSTSCVCIPLTSKVFKVADHVYAKLDAYVPNEPVPETVPLDTMLISETTESNSISPDSADKSRLKQEISGRISVSSYSNFYNDQVPMNQRMRYTFSMHAKNLGNSGFSARELPFLLPQQYQLG